MKSRNAAVQLMLAELRDELLAPPPEARAVDHIAMMRLEENILEAGPRSLSHTELRRSAARRSLGLPAHSRVRRLAVTRTRRIAAVFAALFVFFGNVGPNAAGAFPAAFRSITDRVTDSIVDTFGVPQSDPQSAGRGRGGSAIDGAQPTSTSSGSRAGGAGTASSTTGPPTTGSPNGGAPGTTTPPAGSGDPSGGPSPTDPLVGLKLPPQNNMDRDPSTPPGLPSDFRERALVAAIARLQTCTLAHELAPTGCPQAADLGGVTPASVQWVLINQPLAGAAVIPRPADDGYGNDTQVGAAVSVFGLFQMMATYTIAGDPKPHFIYTSGVAEATMIWSGSAIENVAFLGGSVAGHLPPEIRMPSFERPADVADIAVLMALQTELGEWATAAGGTLVGDPLATATVAFDPVQGDFLVTGTYTTTAPGSTDPVTSPFTARLVYDGQNLFVFSISGA